MKIITPDAAVPDEKAPHVAYKLAVLEAVAGQSEITFADVRKRLALDADTLPDGAIHQIAIDAGLRVARE